MSVQSKIKMKGLFPGLDGLGSKSGRIDGFIINCHGNDGPDYVSGASEDITKVTGAWMKVGIKRQDLWEANSADDFRICIYKLKTEDFSIISTIFLVVLSHGTLGDVIKFQNSGDF
jgi:hypothetical protein